MNNQKIIELISKKLKGKGCKVVNAPGDADAPIVKADVRIVVSHSTTLIGEDTDLLVLLLLYAHQENKNIYFLSDKVNAYKM